MATEMPLPTTSSVAVKCWKEQAAEAIHL